MLEPRPLPNVRSRLQRVVTLASAALVLLGTAQASAQQQVNTGNALDANTQVGGGNVNPNVALPDFRARNLLITGQVTDGRQFRGDVGYTAPGAFQGQLGSDDLFRFRADSFGSTRQVNPARAGTNAGFTPSTGGLSGGDVIYSGFFTPGVGEVAQPGTVRTVVNPDGTRSARIAPGATFNPEFVGSPRLAATAVSAGSGSGLDADAAQPVTNLGQPLGLARNADGTLTRFQASPIFGLRQTPLPSNPQATPEPESEPDADLNGNTPLGLRATDARLTTGRTNPVNLDDPSAPALSSPDFTGLADPTQPRGAAALDTRRTGRVGENATALTSNSAVDPTAPRDPFTGLPASVQLGARLGLDGNLAGNLAADANNARSAEADQQDAQRIERLGQNLFRPLDTTAAAIGDSAYLDLLARIRDRIENPQPNEAADPQADAGNNANANPNAPVRPEWMERIQTPQDDLIRRAEQAGLNAIAGILRAQRDDLLQANANDPQAAAAAQDGEEPELDATTAAMAALIDQLSYDLPRLETLQGQREDRINRNFERAEDAMAQGQFFNAVALYQQLILDAPGNPLARVGQVHAQMAAGMIRSAALNLRRLFEDHPELIATRYAANLLPNQERTLWLRDELERAINDPNQDNHDHGIMLAYLGHQVESRQLVRYGLALATEAAPLDPLLPLLRQVWLGEALEVDLDFDDAE